MRERECRVIEEEKEGGIDQRQMSRDFEGKEPTWNKVYREQESLAAQGFFEQVVAQKFVGGKHLGVRKSIEESTCCFCKDWGPKICMGEEFEDFTTTVSYGEAYNDYLEIGSKKITWEKRMFFLDSYGRSVSRFCKAREKES